MTMARTGSHEDVPDPQALPAVIGDIKLGVEKGESPQATEVAPGWILANPPDGDGLIAQTSDGKHKVTIYPPPWQDLENAWRAEWAGHISPTITDLTLPDRLTGEVQIWKAFGRVWMQGTITGLGEDPAYHDHTRAVLEIPPEFRPVSSQIVPVTCQIDSTEGGALGWPVMQLRVENTGRVTAQSQAGRQYQRGDDGDATISGVGNQGDNDDYGGVARSGGSGAHGTARNGSFGGNTTRAGGNPSHTHGGAGAHGDHAHNVTGGHAHEHSVYRRLYSQHKLPPPNWLSVDGVSWLGVISAPVEQMPGPVPGGV